MDMDKHIFIRMNQIKSGMIEKGIKKFIAYEIPEDRVRQRYGQHFNVILGDLKQTDDLRVLDYDGHHVFYNFALNEMGEPIYHDA